MGACLDMEPRIERLCDVLCVMGRPLYWRALSGFTINSGITVVFVIDSFVGIQGVLIYLDLQRGVQWRSLGSVGLPAR